MHEDEKSISTPKALLYLLGCAVNAEVPQTAVLGTMDWDAVFLLSTRHMVAAAACVAVEKGLAAAPMPLDEMQKTVLHRWQQAKNKAIRKNMLLDAERGALTAYCEGIGCWVLSLKGAVLKEMYPHAGMRQMADNDILFDKKFRQQICDWFAARGYETISVGRSNHDVYRKEPFYNFEMHTALFSDALHPEWAAYYDKVQAQLRSDAAHPLWRHFTEEDFYVYITLHEYKHFSAGGTGVRSLLDRYVFCKANAEKMDEAYLVGALQELGLTEFERAAKALSRELFFDPTAFLAKELSAEQQKLLGYYLGSGTYGTINNHVKNKLTQNGSVTKAGKVQYLLGRLFPPQKVMQGGYPTMAKYKLLLPLCYAHRLITKPVKRRKAIQNEVKIVMKT